MQVKELGHVPNASAAPLIKTSHIREASSMNIHGRRRELPQYPVDASEVLDPCLLTLKLVLQKPAVLRGRGTGFCRSFGASSPQPASRSQCLPSPPCTRNIPEPRLSDQETAIPFPCVGKGTGILVRTEEVRNGFLGFPLMCSASICRHVGQALHGTSTFFPPPRTFQRLPEIPPSHPPQQKTHARHNSTLSSRPRATNCWPGCVDAEEDHQQSF